MTFVCMLGQTKSQWTPFRTAHPCSGFTPCDQYQSEFVFTRNCGRQSLACFPMSTDCRVHYPACVKWLLLSSRRSVVKKVRGYLPISLVRRRCRCCCSEWRVRICNGGIISESRLSRLILLPDRGDFLRSLSHLCHSPHYYHSTRTDGDDDEKGAG